VLHVWCLVHMLVWCLEFVSSVLVYVYGFMVWGIRFRPSVLVLGFRV
jgi:hypothetical protein